MRLVLSRLSGLLHHEAQARPRPRLRPHPGYPLTGGRRGQGGRPPVPTFRSQTGVGAETSSGSDLSVWRGVSAPAPAPAPALVAGSPPAPAAGEGTRAPRAPPSRGSVFDVCPPLPGAADRGAFRDARTADGTAGAPPRRAAPVESFRRRPDGSAARGRAGSMGGYGFHLAERWDRWWPVSMGNKAPN